MSKQKKNWVWFYRGGKRNMFHGTEAELKRHIKSRCQTNVPVWYLEELVKKPARLA